MGIKALFECGTIHTYQSVSRLSPDFYKSAPPLKRPATVGILWTRANSEQWTELGWRVSQREFRCERTIKHRLGNFCPSCLGDMGLRRSTPTHGAIAIIDVSSSQFTKSPICDPLSVLALLVRVLQLANRLELYHLPTPTRPDPP